MNKQGAHTVLLLSLTIFMVLSQSTSARLLLEHSQASSIAITDEEEDMATLMGLQKCNENDEVCLKRRMMADIHLDYIYTQQNPKPKPMHKPKPKPKDSP